MSLFPEKGAKNKKAGRTKSVDTPANANNEHESVRGAEKQAAATLSLGYLFGLHRHMAVEAIKRLWVTPVASVMNCLMIALAFVLPALFYLMVANVQQLGEGWGGQPKVSLYLSSEVGATRKDELQAALRKFPEVHKVIYISAEAGLVSFQKQAGIKGVISELGFNPLPAVLQVTMASEISYSELESLAGRFEKMSGVEQVRLDKKWVQRLLAIADLLKQVAKVLAILLGLTIWLAISNTVGLSIEARKAEIQVVKMVGGTDGFIMLPFLYTGAIYGVAGALMSMLITWGVLIAIVPSVMTLTGLYGSTFQIQGPGLSMFFTLISSGIVLGILGAVAGCVRRLRKLAPC